MCETMSKVPYLLEAAVTADHVGEVVDDREVRLVELGGEMGLGDGEADRVRDALPERAGRDLDTVGDPDLGVARGETIDLAEVLEVVERELIAREVQHGVLQCAGVAVGQHEPVPRGPLRVLRRVPVGIGDKTGAPHRMRRPLSCWAKRRAAGPGEGFKV